MSTVQSAGCRATSPNDPPIIAQVVATASQPRVSEARVISRISCDERISEIFMQVFLIMR